MSMFFVTFFILYAALHAYAFIKAWYAFRFRPMTGSFVALFFLAFIFMPMIVRMLEHSGQESLARALAYGAFIWMTVVFMFFVISLVIDIGRILIVAAAFIFKISLPHSPYTRIALFLIPVVAAVGIVTYGYQEAWNIRTEHVGIETDKLPPGVNSLTVVQISDVHLGLINREKRLERVVKAIKEKNPDLVVSTGDLVDGQINNLNGVSDLLKDVKPRYGKYAIMGNHEFYAGVGVSEDFARKAGFKMLRQRSLTVENLLNIAGVDDEGHRPLDGTGARERSVLESLPRNLFTIFLKHRPFVESSSLGLFDLQLSGHTHGGQVYPFVYVTRLSFPMVAGLYPLDKDSVLYVSRGTGTWGPPVRFLVPPEITVIEIIRK